MNDKMNEKKFRIVYSTKYYRIVGRFVRQMEKEVAKLLKDHRDLSVNVAWDIVTKAFVQADNILTGGYKR